jgi:gamma-butyrobetaine dioxygenase
LDSGLAPIPDYEVYPHTPGLAQAAPAGSIVLTWEDRFLVRFRLRPGDIETCDNGCILHARDAFDPSTEEPLLQGCYVDRDEVQSRIRILEREEARSWL